MEQEFKLKRIEMLLENIGKEEIAATYLELQRQNFVLVNNLSNLVKQWPLATAAARATTAEELSNLGNSSETKS